MTCQFPRREFHLDSAIIEAQVRPQRKHWCSAAALLTVFNAHFCQDGSNVSETEFFEWHPPESLVRHRQDRTRYPGNRRVADLFSDLCRRRGVPGDYLVVDGRSVQGRSARSQALDSLWTSLVQFIRATDAAVVFHTTNHYVPVAGTYENIRRQGVIERFLILSDSSTSSPRLLEPHHVLKGFPIWCMAFEDVLENLCSSNNRGFIFLKRTTGALAQVRMFRQGNAHGSRIGLSKHMTNALCCSHDTTTNAYHKADTTVTLCRQDGAYNAHKPYIRKKYIQLTPYVRKRLNVAPGQVVEIRSTKRGIGILPIHHDT